MSSVLEAGLAPSLLPGRRLHGGPSVDEALASLQAHQSPALAWPLADQGLCASVLRPFKLHLEEGGPALCDGARAWRQALDAALRAHVQGLSEGGIQALADWGHDAALWVLALAASLKLGASGVSFRALGEHEVSCWKWHVDRYPFRLLGLVWGPGTQWVAPSAVRLDRLGCGHEHPQVGGPDAVVPWAESIQQVPSPSWFLMPGRLWPGEVPGALVHRSPAHAAR